MPDPSQEWEDEARKRVRRFLARLYTAKGITLAYTQEILGEYGDADHLIAYMQENKIVFRSPLSDLYEFTHKGLVQFYDTVLGQASREGRIDRAEMSEDEVIRFVQQEAGRMLHA